ncbi:Ig-like domain-containing protein [Veronia nyctiphanis]|uniref:Ig-like domain-containing protein n=1 Tax=Veronia nyctiphanis TaxID=1278244 RepID=UPI001F458BF6|nr:Ig-like domain-containing protein [Veronia nyctiphanis]
MTIDEGFVNFGLAEGAETTTDDTPTISGKVEPGSTVSIFNHAGIRLGDAVVESNGDWSFTFQTPLAIAEMTYSIKATDLQDNTSVIDEQTFTVEAPLEEMVAPPPETKEVTNSQTPSFEGNVENGVTAKLFIDGNEFDSVDISDGHFALSVPAEKELDEGNYHYRIVIDTNDGGSPIEKSGEIEIDITPPEIWLDNDVLHENDSVIGASGYESNDFGATVTVSKGDEVIGQTTIGTDGSWHIDNPNYKHGEEIIISIEDIAGNSDSHIYQVD